MTDPPDPQFRAADHYWFVAGDETRLFSSALRDYVQPDAAAFATFKRNGGAPTYIKSEAELWRVLGRFAPNQLPDEVMRPEEGKDKTEMLDDRLIALRMRVETLENTVSRTTGVSR